jgi:DNA mismatch repair protein MutS2
MVNDLDPSGASLEPKGETLPSLYPDSAWTTLELDRLREAVAERCHTPSGPLVLDEWMELLHDKDSLRQRQALYRECLASMQQGRPWPALRWEASRDQMVLWSKEGYVLTEEDLRVMGSGVQSAVAWEKAMAQPTGTGTSAWAQERGSLLSLDAVQGVLSGLVGLDGTLLPQASPVLARLLVQQQRKTRELRDSMEQLWKRYRDAGWATDSGVTLRDDRYVLVLNSEGRKNVAGLVHDVSATGQHFYTEPSEVWSLNNGLREQEWEIRAEKYRILQKLSHNIRLCRPDWMGWSQLLARADAVNAVCSWSMGLGTVRFPEIWEAGRRWIDVRHPLLVLECKSRGTTAVPFSWTLDQAQRIMVVSGPNAGGKSVFLKTVGLSQWLFQLGWPLLCGEDSACSLVGSVILGMGDRQDLHQDLSTYAAHLQLMAFALRHAGPNDLILLDEFGSGTDPALGGALAEAMLETWFESGPTVVLNTHYGNLKRLASRCSAVLDARMGFDLTTLRPTYRLLVGAPGSSYANELAARAGLPTQVMERAEALADSIDVRSEALLAQWMDQKQKAEELVLLNQTKEELLDRLIQKQTEAKAQAEQAQQEAYRDFRNKLRRQLEEKRREAGWQLQTFVEELDRQRNRPSTRPGEASPRSVAFQALGTLSQALDALNSNNPTDHQASESTLEPPVFVAGQRVVLKEGGPVGLVLRCEDQDVEWTVDSVRMRTASRLLRPADPVPMVRPVPSPSRRWGRESIPVSQSRDAGNPSLSLDSEQVLDLRGYRMHEWEKPLQQRLDRALVAGDDRLFILHGKGSGVLRQAIRTYLGRQKQVLSWRDAPDEQGGSGWTYVDFGE